MDLEIDSGDVVYIGEDAKRADPTAYETAVFDVHSKKGFRKKVFGHSGEEARESALADKRARVLKNVEVLMIGHEHRMSEILYFIHQYPEQQIRMSGKDHDKIAEDRHVVVRKLERAVAARREKVRRLMKKESAA